MYNDIDFNSGEIADARIIICNENWVRNINNRKYNGLIYIIKGHLSFIKNDIETDLYRNNIILLEKNSSYKVISVLASEIIVLSFDQPNPSFLSNNSLIKLNEYSIIAGLLKDLVLTYTKNSYAYKLKCKSIFYNIVYHLVNEYNFCEIKKTNEMLFSSVMFMHENFDKNITVSDLANRAFLSNTHYRRLFKNSYGKSPLEYLNSMRINKAKQLIKTSLYTFSEICSLTGFNDLYYFSRVFKKVTGLTPTEYKKSET